MLFIQNIELFRKGTWQSIRVRQQGQIFLPGGGSMNRLPSKYATSLREAAKKSYFLSGRDTKKGGGAKRMCH